MAKMSDKLIEKIEKKAKEEVNEMFASIVRDVEYIEVFYKNGEIEKFEYKELVTYWRSGESIFVIETKTREIIVNVDETIKIIISKFTKDEKRNIIKV